jgi:hypothetical protein
MPVFIFVKKIEDRKEKYETQIKKKHRITLNFVQRQRGSLTNLFLKDQGSLEAGLDSYSCSKLGVFLSLALKNKNLQKIKHPNINFEPHGSMDHIHVFVLC